MARSRTRKNRPSTVDSPDNAAAAAALLDEASGGRSTAQDQIEEQDERDVLQQLRETAGNGAYCRIHRRALGETTLAVLGTMELSEYSLERVQELYGGGEYKVDCYAIRDGKHAMVRRLRFTISHAIPAKHPLGAAPAAAAAPAGTDLVELAKVLKSATAGDGGMSAVMPLILAMMQAQSQTMQTLLASMAKKDDGGGVQAVLLKMLEMERDRAKERTPVSELLESFSAFKKISGGGKDDDEDETIWDKAGRLLTPLVDGLAARYLAEEPNPPMQQIHSLVTIPPAAPAGQPDPAAGGEPSIEQFPPQPAANGAAPAAAANTNPGASRPAPMNPLVKLKINQLRQAALVAAQRQADAKEFALELLDEVPPRYYDNLEDMAAAEDWLQQLYGDNAQLLAAATQQKVWLTAMRDALLAELKASA